LGTSFFSPFTPHDAIGKKKKKRRKDREDLIGPSWSCNSWEKEKKEREETRGPGIVDE